MAYQSINSQEKNPASHSNPQEQRIFKVIVIGDSNVGKTCLTYRFCEGRFPKKADATIGVDFREKSVDCDGERIKLQIWDTAGQERFRKSMVSHYYRNAHAVVFVYDVTKRESFNNIAGWIQECNRFLPNNQLPMLLIGNKCDLVDNVQVSTIEAQTFADHCSMPLFETSAKEDGKEMHVVSIFMTLAHKLKNSKNLKIPSVADNIPGLTDSSGGVFIGRAHDYRYFEQENQGCFC